MTDNKKVEISKENMEEVTGGAPFCGVGDMRRGSGVGGGDFGDGPCGPTSGVGSFGNHPTPVPADKADGSRVDSVDVKRQQLIQQHQ